MSSEGEFHFLSKAVQYSGDAGGIPEPEPKEEPGFGKMACTFKDN